MFLLLLRSLDNAMKMCRNSEVTIKSGVFNAKVGNQMNGFTIDKYGLEERNCKGSRLEEFAKVHDMIVIRPGFRNTQ